MKKVKAFSLLVLLLAWLGEAAAQGALFNVNDFGAMANGVEDSSEAFMRAWKEACEWDGMSIVLVPYGTFLVGPILFKGPCKGPIAVQVQGLVKALTDLDKFPSDGWIVFQSVDSLIVTGGGTIDGQGPSAWPHNNCPNSFQCKLLPTSLRFNYITNSAIQSISSIDSKFFHINIFESKNIELHDLKISAPDQSPNTDGIHIGNSIDISISKSVIGTGDDCVSIGPGSKNITISKIFCGPGHGISVGSLGKYENEEDVIDLSVSNCTFTNTTNGIRIKTWRGYIATQASNFSFQSIIMNNVYNPIIIDQDYCPYYSCPEKPPSHVEISNIIFEDIKGTSASQVAVKLLCSEDIPCQRLELKDIELEYNEKGAISRSSCSNVQGVSYGSQVPPSCV